MTGFAGVAVMASLVNILSCVEPIVPLPDLVQALVDTQVSS
jgi:hypothetical protein